MVPCYPLCLNSVFFIYCFYKHVGVIAFHIRKNVRTLETSYSDRFPAESEGAGENGADRIVAQMILPDLLISDIRVIKLTDRKYSMQVRVVELTERKYSVLVDAIELADAKYSMQVSVIEQTEEI